MSTLAQEAIKGVVDAAAPHELYTLAVTIRDAYKKQVRDNGMELDPQMLRTMNANVEFYKQLAS